MAIPEDVRRVPRPKNTRVLPSSTGRYAVKSRIGCKYVEGRRVPVEGPIVGYIIDGEYRPLKAGPDTARRVGSMVDVKEWGHVQLCERLGQSLLEDVKAVYDAPLAEWIFAVAELRCCYPGVTDRALFRKYHRSFVSEFHPGLAMSKNAVCDRLQTIGTEYTRIKNFMRARASKVGGCDCLVIDGTLQQDESIVNPLSRVSRKTSRRGHREFSLMYAFSLELMEPICSKAYPGNMLDSKAVSDFMTSNGIASGVIIADKGFPPESIKGTLGSMDPKARSKIHYLLPLKDNRTIIDDLGLLSFDGKLEHHPGVMFKKSPGPAGTWYYSFRDPFIAADEERAFLEAHSDFTAEQMERIRRRFGMLAFESDLDAPPALVYSMYEERWFIETLFKFYHTVLGFDDTREHNQFSMMSSTFIDLLSAVMGMRMKREIDRVKAFEGASYSDALDFLRGAMRHKDTSKEGSGWELMAMADKDAEVLMDIGLVPRPEPLPRGTNKDGTPRKVRCDKGVKRGPRKKDRVSWTRFAMYRKKDGNLMKKLIGNVVTCRHLDYLEVTKGRFYSIDNIKEPG
jgi:hypothetical protein